MIFTGAAGMICRHMTGIMSVWTRRLNGTPLSTVASNSGLFHIGKEVEDALCSKKPIVALESTIITHGMPYPQNMKTALEVESIIRQNGCTPATVAVIAGKVHVGLTEQELEYLAASDTEVTKISRRDFPYILSKKTSGGTTVSGTMLIAHKVGIPIFVTGGVGGVHRDGENTLDVSADLRELGRTPVAVVSAGVKSILDIGKTLEYLETEGVCVAVYGKSLDFPAFFTAKSGFKAPYNVETPKEAAAMIGENQCMGLRSGILIGVPIPGEKEQAGADIEKAIKTALDEVKEQNIQGKAITPYILEMVNQLTSGSSLQAIVMIWKTRWPQGDMSKLSLDFDSKSDFQTFRDRRICSLSQSYLTIAGDILSMYSNFRPSFNGKYLLSGGITILNFLFVTDVSWRGVCVLFQDLSGVAVIEGQRTATYCAILNDIRQVLFGIGDMDIHTCITPQYISMFESEISSAPLVVVDGNVTPDAIACVCGLCWKHGVPVWFEPTDLKKAGKPFLTTVFRKLTYASPNLSELSTMFWTIKGQQNSTRDLDTVLSKTVNMASSVTKQIPVLIVTLGRHGVLICRRTGTKEFPVKGDTTESNAIMTAIHYPACTSEETTEVVSVSGAGDCLAAAMIHGIVNGHDSDTCIKGGLLAAQMSLHSSITVPVIISSKIFTPKSIHAKVHCEGKQLHV
ncbi:hypothetical protein ScPMuIL_009199 [Solemya velum]